MGTITGQQIVDRAWIILQDTVGTPGTRWPASECLMWLNDGLRDVVVQLPSAYVKTVVQALAEGTRQNLSNMGLPDAVQFMKAPRNYLGTGPVYTPGRAITTKPMAWIDEQRPGWHNDPVGEIVHVFFDENDPKTFYNWPPVVSGARAEIVYAAVPPIMSALTDTITLDDIYSNALQFYLLFRAFSKNATYNRSPGAAAANLQLYLQALGIKDQRLRQLNANLQMLSDGAGVAGAQRSAQ